MLIHITYIIKLTKRYIINSDFNPHINKVINYQNLYAVQFFAQNLKQAVDKETDSNKAISKNNTKKKPITEYARFREN